MQISYKLDHEGEWIPLPTEYTIPREKPGHLYKQEIPITDDKYKHLQEMKLQIPSGDWAFFDGLSHSGLPAQSGRKSDLRNIRIHTAMGNSN